MKRRLEFAVTREMAGRSVRQFLQEELSFSGHQISRLKFQEEGIRVDGEKVYVNHVLKEGEILTVGLTEQVLRRDTEGGKPGKIWEAPAPELSKYPLQVLYEDSDLLIVNNRKTGQGDFGYCDFCQKFGSCRDDPEAEGGRKADQDLSGPGGRPI